MGVLVYFLAVLAVTNAFPEEENNDPTDRFFGGDMMLTPLQRLLVESGGDLSMADRAKGRSAMSNASVLWLPNDKTVPYTITPLLESLPDATYGIMTALREWEERSCLKFKRRDNERDYINFFKERGCWSWVGRQGGRQNISLGDGCFGTGTVVHEIGHAMGFGHEQNRPDRDDYIKIRWENIPEGKKHNFQKYSDKKVDSLGSPYDYKSFMQYSKRSFGINDSVTLDPIKPDIFQLGQRLGFTKHDQFQAMGLYRCNGKTTRKAQEPETYTPKGDHVCDFENGLCYNQDGNDDFDWSRRYGSSPSWNTGPETDHTTGRMGTYVYIEASYPRKTGDVARLLTNIFPAENHGECLSFFYHMYSTNKTMMGDFNVYVRDTMDYRLIFSRKGSQENKWLQANIDIKPVGDYQIIFEGIRGSGYQGDIAFDDVTLSHGKCTPNVPKPKKLEKKMPCLDTTDRERRYCKQWKKAGFCVSHEKVMSAFCRKTCKFC